MRSSFKQNVSPPELDFSLQSERFVHWCKNDALPLWANHGVDWTGGFFETLNYDGSPDLTVKRRVRVQARQSYVYSLAVTKGWYRPSSIVADHGWRFLTQRGFAGGDHISDHSFKGCAHLLNPDGSLHDGTRDTYAQAFLILTSAWRYKATADPEALGVLYATTLFLITYFKSETGGWIENCRNSLPRRQNPHMHLFEAFMAAYEATDDCLFLDLADQIFELFESRFYDTETACLLEYFGSDWRPQDEAKAKVEPGHMMEWCWLLEWYGRLSGKPMKSYVDALFSSSIKMGMNPRTGLLINEFQLDGEISNGSSRLWPQTEFIKACIAKFRLGDVNALSLAALVIDRVFDGYLQTPLRGGWHDSLDCNGKTEANQMPASSFYHLACAVGELEKLNEELRH